LNVNSKPTSNFFDRKKALLRARRLIYRVASEEGQELLPHYGNHGTSRQGLRYEAKGLPVLRRHWRSILGLPVIG
jgi:hypothetical protein